MIFHFYRLRRIQIVIIFSLVKFRLNDRLPHSRLFESASWYVTFWLVTDTYSKKWNLYLWLDIGLIQKLDHFW